MTSNNHKNQDNETKKNDSLELDDENKEITETSAFKEQETDDKIIREEKEDKQNSQSKSINNEEIETNEEENDNKSLEDSESKLEQELQSLTDEKLRLLAEMENIRKRSEKDKVDSIRYGSMNLAREILSINDNLSRALDSAKSEEKKSKSINSLIDGLNMVQKEFMNILKKHGIERIESMEKKFDHNFHQAVLEIETNDYEEGFVVQEIQSGYIMYERLLRPAMVGVSKKPENNKKNK
tara:strand:+ start:914 stop:1630 length:717 start_codon:yes stop_codon:yes gene_type:complete